MLHTYMTFAAETAYLAGLLTLGYFGTGVRPDFKPDDTPVTVADRLAEELIRSRIESAFPHHQIVGEEFGATEHLGVSHRWFVDPIDGTKAFIRGVPLYAVLIGLEIEGRPEVGAAYYPATDELICAATGEGCWWNGRRARVSQITDLSRAYVSCTDPGSFAAYGRAAEWERIAQRTYHRAGWSDAYGYMLVATGRIEIMLDPIMKPWDCGPFPAILGEAGGYFGDWHGNVSLYAGEALATTQALLPTVLDALHGA
jgi:myo-inositol-1(or 4)-monophosphatase